MHIRICLILFLPLSSRMIRFMVKAIQVVEGVPKQRLLQKLLQKLFLQSVVVLVVLVVRLHNLKQPQHP